MEEIFKGFHLELVMNNIYYEEIRESWGENDRTMLACEAPPKDFHFFERNFLRLETRHPREYV